LCLDVAGDEGNLRAPRHQLHFRSYDKANAVPASRCAAWSGRRLRIFSEVQRQIGVPVLTDVHDIDQIIPLSAAWSMLQTPAFLCRQTDFIHAVATCGKPVNIKKGQFLAPGDMKNVVDKARG
jgi:2-dehydro-3-deoxyphosphooctonate aldolase (KDO 8-P synthase)